MKLIEESVINEAAKEFCEKQDEQYGESWSNDYEELPVKIAEFTSNFTQQQLQPFIVELLDWTSQNYTSSDGIHCKIGNTGIDNWITSEQLLEEFIEFKNKK